MRKARRSSASRFLEKLMRTSARELSAETYRSILQTSGQKTSSSKKTL